MINLIDQTRIKREGEVDQEIENVIEMILMIDIIEILIINLMKIIIEEKGIHQFLVQGLHHHHYCQIDYQFIIFE